jgi:hypothetical protein
MSRLSKQEIYSILWLNNQKKDVNEISKELKISTEKVEKIIEKNNSTNAGYEPKVASEKTSKNATNKSLMINTTSGKNIKNVSIMTQAASTVFDEQKKKYSKKDNLNKNNIFRPNG